MMLPTQVGRVLQRAWPAAFLLLSACTEQSGPAVGTASTTASAHAVGSGACRACHDSEYERWLGSHHQLAMQAADASTVSGDFVTATLVPGLDDTLTIPYDQPVLSTCRTWMRSR